MLKIRLLNYLSRNILSRNGSSLNISALNWLSFDLYKVFSYSGCFYENT